jgi:hypothetical protein
MSPSWLGGMMPLGAPAASGLVPPDGASAWWTADHGVTNLGQSNMAWQDRIAGVSVSGLFTPSEVTLSTLAGWPALLWSPAAPGPGSGNSLSSSGAELGSLITTTQWTFASVWQYTGNIGQDWGGGSNPQIVGDVEGFIQISAAYDNATQIWASAFNYGVSTGPHVYGVNTGVVGAFQELTCARRDVSSVAS